MSDVARNYVKDLDIAWHLKALLFLLADYHNIKDSCAWPSLETLATVTGKDPRNVKRLIRQLEATGRFQYLPGSGRGNRGEFYFLELDPAATSERLCKPRKEVIKAVTKEVISSNAIRKNHEPLTKTSPNPSLQEGNSQFTLTRRDHTRIARWIERQTMPNLDGTSKLGASTWAEVLQWACADLMMPFEAIKHDLLLMDYDLWAARLGLKKETVGASA